MDRRRNALPLAFRLALVGTMMTVSACGISKGEAGVAPSKTAASNDPDSTGEAKMREPASPCERVPHETVEGASRLKLEPGDPSEQYDLPRCTWRRRGGDVAVSARLWPDQTFEEFEEEFGSGGAEKLPDLGQRAYWDEGFSVLYVFTDEGGLDVMINNAKVTGSIKEEGAITIARTIMETTEVPDTTTTTTSSTPVEAEGLCARVSFETVERVAGLAVEPGVLGPGITSISNCTFREPTGGAVVALDLFDETFKFDQVTDLEPIDALDVQAGFKEDGASLYFAASEGVVAVRIYNGGLTTEQVRDGTIELAKEFLASA